MTIVTKGGQLPHRIFTFPDGQRHFELLARDEWRTATIETAITSADDLFDVLLAKDVLDACGIVTSLNIRYLLGARMDRRIAQMQPFTLQVVARVLAGAGFRKIRILDPHSTVANALLGAETVWPTAVIHQVLARYLPSELVIVAPDAGSKPRVRTLVGDVYPILECEKHRDSVTGKLSGFRLGTHLPLDGKTCLIVDDICDGGGTFAAVGELLRGAGAAEVDLFVTHGIFSKNTPLAHIRTIYTTDSYPDVMTRPFSPTFVPYIVTMPVD